MLKNLIVASLVGLLGANAQCLNNHEAKPCDDACAANVKAETKAQIATCKANNMEAGCCCPVDISQGYGATSWKSSECTNANNNSTTTSSTTTSGSSQTTESGSSHSESSSSSSTETTSSTTTTSGGWGPVHHICTVHVGATCPDGSTDCSNSINGECVCGGSCTGTLSNVNGEMKCNDEEIHPCTADQESNAQAIGLGLGLLLPVALASL